MLLVKNGVLWSVLVLVRGATVYWSMPYSQYVEYIFQVSPTTATSFTMFV